MVTIRDFSFSPTEVEAQEGDTVTVVNKDGAEHSLTAVDGSFDTGRFMGGPGVSRTVKVTGTGRIEFRCDVHPFMPHGFIRVSG